MQTRLNPYISFKDNAREAMEFYKSVFGGELALNTFKEGGMPHDPSEADKIMHAMLETDNGITFMASDTPTGMEHQEGSNISISLSGDNEEELKNYWEKLSEGGNVDMPLEKAPWGDSFGMLTDKFGIHWMVNISGPKTEGSEA
jgi:PhnB protein